ncbi:aspartate--tRNA(Asn) ligase [Candidatus Micrarchaeota archaeon RBG_16_36_9]|nr:MAG: aspartate--tRNA(Asn) ligase [Candidatus Micrarchaeota archaeon RBG_16_36_9]
METLGDWQRTHYSKEIKPEMDNQEVILMGFVRELRDIGKLKFIKLADREGFIQIIAKKEVTLPSTIEMVEKLGREDVIAVKGTVKENKEAPNGVEIIPIDIKILNIAEKPLPLEMETKKTPALLNTRLDQRPLDLRKPENQAIFKIQSKIVEGMQNFLIKKGFLQVFTPSLLGGSSEGGSDVFAVPYFDKEAFLRQDPQLHRELVIISGFDKIFDLGPNWRAEKSNTIYHLCEHRGIAPEMGFIRDETDVMRLEEQMVVESIRFVTENCQKELEILNKKITIPKIPFPELRFPEIYKILGKLGFKIKDGDDLNREAEEMLAGYVKEEYDHDFFFINRFPFALKPFYVMKVDDEPKYARSVDLIFKGLEMSSGGQREHRYKELMKNVKEKKLDPKNISWFTNFFKYGAPPVGGFCLGIERFTMKLLNLDNIREATLFARDPERLFP